MATKVPRIAVTVSPEVFAAVERLAELSGTTKSSILGEIAETSLPVIRGLVEAAEAYQQLDAEKQQALIAEMEKHEARLMPDAARLQGEFLESIKPETPTP